MNTKQFYRFHSKGRVIYNGNTTLTNKDNEYIYFPELDLCLENSEDMIKKEYKGKRDNIEWGDLIFMQVSKHSNSRYTIVSWVK